MRRLVIPAALLILDPTASFADINMQGLGTETTELTVHATYVLSPTSGFDEVIFSNPCPNAVFRGPFNTYTCRGFEVQIFGDGDLLNENIDWERELYNDFEDNRGYWYYVPSTYDVIEVTFTYTQEIELDARPISWEIPMYPPGTNYTNPTDFIDSNHPDVWQTAQLIRAEYDLCSGCQWAPERWDWLEYFTVWMANNLTEGDQPNYLTASEALLVSTVDCKGFTIAFCGLCRASGLPAGVIHCITADGTSTAGFDIDAGHHITPRVFNGHPDYSGSQPWISTEPPKAAGYVPPLRILEAAGRDAYYMQGIHFRIWGEWDPTAQLVDFWTSSTQGFQSGSLMNLGSRTAPDCDIWGLEVLTAPPLPPGMMPPGDTWGDPCLAVGDEDAAESWTSHLSFHPNPFRSSTRISCDLPGTEAMELEIFGVDGRRVKTTLVGSGEVVWDGTDARGRVVASGVYFVRLRTGTKACSAKLVKLR